MASAMPSRLRQMTATRGRIRRRNGLPAAAARTKNSSTASPDPFAGRIDSPGTRNTHSNGTSSLARLVTRTDSPGCPQQSFQQHRQPVEQVLAVSRTSSVSRSEPAQQGVRGGAALMLAEPERGGDGRSDHRRVGDRHQVDEPAPSANRSARSATTLSASRVLPTPPGPTADTRRCAPSASANTARSAPRPTKGSTATAPRGHRGIADWG